MSSHTTIPQTIGLIVIHGIGEQKEGKTIERILRGIRLSFPTAKTNQNGRSGSIKGIGECSIKVYEVHWADILSGRKVRGSFTIQAIHQSLWYPWFNRKTINFYDKLYPGWLIALWTVVLFPFAAILTAAYYPVIILLPIFSKYFNNQGVGKNEFLISPEKLAQKARIDRRANPWLDNYVADIFNYVKSAGDAEAPVPDAVDQIYDRFHATLQRAVKEDGCSEIQILAHSLGTVIAYHALTRFRAQTADLIQLENNGSSEAMPHLTRLYTTGSPLEKVRFFWPKITDTPLQVTNCDFRWDNFINPMDRISGLLKRFGGRTTICNHNVVGGGPITAHLNYSRSTRFISVLMSGLTSEPQKAQFSSIRRFGWLCFGLLEIVIAPLLLLIPPLFGFGLLIGYGLLAGWILGYIPFQIVESIRSFFGAEWQFHNTSFSALKTFFIWMVPSSFIGLSLLSGCINGKREHEKHWCRTEGLKKVVDCLRAKAEAIDPCGRSSQYRTVKTKIILKFLGGFPMIDTSAKENTSMPQKNFGHFFINIAFLVAIAVVGLWWTPQRQEFAWIIIMSLMGAFMITFGHGVTGCWNGVFIDGRFRISLGRLQLLAWSLVILSAIIAAGFHNVRAGLESPLEITIPSELWVLLGITTASAISAPAVLSGKRNIKPDKDQYQKTESKRSVSVNEGEKPKSVILENRGFEDARWGDILKGDESGNGAAIDVGKIQMFFFTFVLVVTYGAAIFNLLATTKPITGLPPVDEGMNVLLGISHTAYVSNKAVSHSREEEPKVEGDPSAPGPDETK